MLASSDINSRVQSEHASWSQVFRPGSLFGRKEVWLGHPKCYKSRPCARGYVVSWNLKTSINTMSCLFIVESKQTCGRQQCSSGKELDHKPVPGRDGQR